MPALAEAYTDDTDADTMKLERDAGTISKCRDLPIDEHVRRFKEMLVGSEEGLKYCVRGKIDMQCLNKCMRDPVFYRCKVDEPHHRHGWKYKAYPTYDFCCAIIDSYEGVTHALRSLEYSDRKARVLSACCPQMPYWVCPGMPCQVFSIGSLLKGVASAARTPAIRHLARIGPLGCRIICGCVCLIGVRLQRDSRMCCV